MNRGTLNTNRVDAQQARRFLDRVVGFMVSPLLWEKVGRGLSAGRVQSVALKMIVEREREIRAFQPQEYWTVHADLENRGDTDSDKIRFEVKKHLGKAFNPVNKAEADVALTALKQAGYSVTKREDKPTKSKPSAPFITSTLQQAASTRLGFGVKKTMMMAQRLYEAGYITYMRTDSTNLSADAIEACRDYIKVRHGARYLPAEQKIYSSKSGAQEAHEAIRPSNIDIAPGSLNDMEADARKLYQLIWQQFVACQMTEAEFTATTVTVTAGDYELTAKGRVTRFDGYLAVMPASRKSDDDGELPDLQQGDALQLLVLVPQQHFTKPTARFSEASLVKELEKRGIGRPSTYAAIISTIQDRGYVRIENKRIFAEKIGDIVTDRLSESFTDLMDYGFTATMEEHLDEIANGTLNWKTLLNRFYKDFSRQVESAKEADAGMRQNTPTETDIPCAQCGRPMMIRTAGTGVFLGCSGYALPPKERCKNTINLTAGDEAINIDEDDEAESKQLMHKHRCKICNTAMDSYLLDEKRKLHVCGNNPDCSGFETETGQYVIKGYEGPVIECDKCASEMQLKTGRFGKYFGCTGQNAEGEPCKNTRKLLRNGQAATPKVDAIAMPELRCEKVEDHYVLRDGASGLFLAASQFPKHRETRAPLVKELLPYADRIDEKYQFLLRAPATDPDGLPTIVRYSRKTAEQYVRSEEDGKPTGWSAYYTNGKWVTADKGSK